MVCRAQDGGPRGWRTRTSSTGKEAWAARHLRLQEERGVGLHDVVTAMVALFWGEDGLGPALGCAYRPASALAVSWEIPSTFHLHVGVFRHLDARLLTGRLGPMKLRVRPAFAHKGALDDTSNSCKFKTRAQESSSVL